MSQQQSSIGQQLNALRPRITRECPDCKKDFTGYAEAIRCRACNRLIYQRRQRALKKLSE